MTPGRPRGCLLFGTLGAEKQVKELKFSKGFVSIFIFAYLKVHDPHTEEDDANEDKEVDDSLESKVLHRKPMPTAEFEAEF